MKTRTTTWRSQATSRCGRAGFSLVELMVVVAVAMILTGMLLPALNKLRDSVNTVVCASNLRQIAMGTAMYASDHKSNLPSSVHLKIDNWRPQELMASYTPEAPQGWDGIGVLFQQEYCSAFECFYCPAHRGAHPPSKYAGAWEQPGYELIYTNYHFAGNRDWETQQPRFYQRLDSLVLFTDGLRTVSDINHRFGMNVAYGDMSVRWRADLVTVFELLPDDEADVAVGSKERYGDIWAGLQKAIMPN